MQRIIIFANGEYQHLEFYQQLIEDHDYIICADGGTNHALRMGILPHLVVGDLDSIDLRVYQSLQGSSTDFYKVSSEKDESDLELAVSIALEKKPQEIIILGALGKRVDHLFANLMLLTLPLKQGVPTKIVDEDHEILVINNSIELTGKVGDYLSLFALSPQVTGIITQGLKYPLKEESLYLGPTRGLSNEFNGDKASIQIGEGLLLVIKARS